MTDNQGPAFKKRDDFSSPIYGVRRAMCEEYNRPIREALDNGFAVELQKEDFAHLINPQGLGFLVYAAHCEALQAIEDWKKAHPPEPAPPPVEASDEGGTPEPLGELPDAIDAAAEEDDEDGSRKDSPARSSSEQENKPIMEMRPLPVVRGQIFDAGLAGLRNEAYPGKPAARLSVSEETRRTARQAVAAEETEELLNSIIGEMHFDMREIAFPSMCQATDFRDRMQWVDATIRLAEAGAKVADSVARVRGHEAPQGRRPPRSNAKR